MHIDCKNDFVRTRTKLVLALKNKFKDCNIWYCLEMVYVLFNIYLVLRHSESLNDVTDVCIIQCLLILTTQYSILHVW